MVDCGLSHLPRPDNQNHRVGASGQRCHTHIDSLVGERTPVLPQSRFGAHSTSGAYRRREEPTQHGAAHPCSCGLSEGRPGLRKNLDLTEHPGSQPWRGVSDIELDPAARGQENRLRAAQHPQHREQARAVLPADRDALKRGQRRTAVSDAHHGQPSHHGLRSSVPLLPRPPCARHLGKRFEELSEHLRTC